MIYPRRGWRRMMFRLPIHLWRLGLARLCPANFLLLTTTGRKSGLPRRTMVEYSNLDGRFYLASGWAKRTQWYRNIRADPLVTLQTAKEGAVSGRAAVVTDDDEIAKLYVHMRGKSPVWNDYLESWGMEDDVGDFVAKKDRLCILRVDPVNAPTPRPLEADLKWVWPVASVALLAAIWLALR